MANTLTEEGPANWSIFSLFCLTCQNTSVLIFSSINQNCLNMFTYQTIFSNIHTVMYLIHRIGKQATVETIFTWKSQLFILYSHDNIR